MRPKTRESSSRWPEIIRLVPILAVLCLVEAGCGGSQPASNQAHIPAPLLREARPIGRGPQFHPPLRGRPTGRCGRGLGDRYGVHVEVFGANRVVILPAGIGTRAPRRIAEGRISDAACFGSLVTLEPTGLVLVRPGAMPSLADLFRAWGQPLSDRRLAGFSAPRGRSVRVFVDGRLRPGPPGRVPLTRNAEIVLEVGPYVPPHHTYTFPPGI